MIISDIRAYLAGTVAASADELAAALKTDIEMVRMSLEFMEQKGIVESKAMSCGDCSSKASCGNMKEECVRWYRLKNSS